MTTAVGLFLLLGAMLIGLFTLIRDEKRKKRMTTLRSDFVSNVTHELKTPLTSINMFAESILLGRVKSEKDLKKYANVIVKESERLKRMINNILDFSRKENDKLRYHLKECDLLDVVNSTMEEMNYWLEINKFDVTLDLQQKIIAVVDPDGIKQVLSNLISNAIKYSVIKKKLIVRLYKKEGKAFIEVEDQGIGIPENKHKSIFEKFYRVNSKKNENIGGTGLGLTVSKDIIEAQNGKLLVSSILGKGSKFTIVLNI
jgi:two-component system phosphate regulon sensor histidine kinase PhoR